MKPLTQHEEELLVVLKGCDRCPSIDELAEKTGRAKSWLHRVLAQLETKGFVACIVPNKGRKRPARSLVLTPLADAHNYNPYHADLSRIPTETLRAEIEQREAA